MVEPCLYHHWLNLCVRRWRNQETRSYFFLQMHNLSIDLNCPSQKEKALRKNNWPDVRQKRCLHRLPLTIHFETLVIFTPNRTSFHSWLKNSSLPTKFFANTGHKNHTHHKFYLVGTTVNLLDPQICKLSSLSVNRIVSNCTERHLSNSWQVKPIITLLSFL